ncbi:MAG: hypothetical protein HY594_01565 [Candidatus Omnitrophica bacterium]|nr:hypothetical protein [Candidatus Omnitrophota bacterium]
MQFLKHVGFGALVLGFASTAALPPAFALYGEEPESEDRGEILEPADTDDFNSAASVDRYLQGNVKITTLAMIRDVGTALHKENLKTHEEIGALRREVQQLTQEVRRLNSGGSRR